MAERLIEHPDGTTERVSDGTGTTTVVERSGGSGAGILIGLAALVIVVIAAIYFMNMNNSETAKNNAITGAAKSVERTADKAGDAVDKATN